MRCFTDLPWYLPQFLGIEKYTEDNDYTPEMYALLEKECGKIPEGAVPKGEK